MASEDTRERQEAIEKLLEFTYQALHRIAESKLRRERSNTRATRLVNEMVPGLLQRRNRFNDRKHFFAWAKRQMDRVYVSQKRSEPPRATGAGISMHRQIGRGKGIHPHRDRPPPPAEN